MAPMTPPQAQETIGSPPRRDISDLRVRLVGEVVVDRPIVADLRAMMLERETVVVVSGPSRRGKHRR